VRAWLRSLEQLMPFATAGELIAQMGQRLVSVSPGTTARAALHEMVARDPRQPFAAGSTSYQDDAERTDWLRDPVRGEYPYNSKGW
jgi:hypothetical protein